MLSFLACLTFHDIASAQCELASFARMLPPLAFFPLPISLPSHLRPLYTSPPRPFEHTLGILNLVHLMCRSLINRLLDDHDMCYVLYLSS